MLWSLRDLQASEFSLKSTLYFVEGSISARVHPGEKLNSSIKVSDVPTIPQDIQKREMNLKSNYQIIFDQLPREPISQLHASFRKVQY